VQPDIPADISEEDLDRVVRAFYDRVRDDARLGPIFNNAIDDWEHHLRKLQAFWSSVILNSDARSSRVRTLGPDR